ncbi:Ribosomal large subunit pseudouridine synthase B [bioreactor metagenome]|uniref:Ribosomal large subunit pseudouridine synthase B n=1 Tax=bioreactor metagenome TaxID=1076179 RepID=A0A644T620_9ZZZZ|nr:pseudouridine synthase [Candidatus Elulimicrobiales bacterium]
MKIKVDLKEYKKEEKESGIRINKFLSEFGILSRREADKLIAEKKIHINDRIALLGDRVKENDSVFINQELKKLKYFIYNKKRGEETAFKIIDKVRYEPIGRLDKESEGLLIYSNDYRIVEKLLNPKNKLEREYVVRVREKATPRVKTLLEKGIKTREASYSPAKKITLDEEDRSFIKIVLVEGKKHEIRRMLNALNLTILSLKRIRFTFIKLERLKAGEFRELKGEELKKFLESLNIK